MLKRNLVLGGFMALFALLVVFSSCNKDDENITNQTDCSLTPEQIDGIQYMREEEKLARDVYHFLSEKWNVQVFSNIEKSEQNHMDQLLSLVVSCEIDDYVLPGYGEFTNPHIQDLYDLLTAKGSLSLKDALEVGATIEDVDIYDLEEFALETDNETLLDIYESLTCGSRNHMRSFVNQLNIIGAEYTPQYISQAEYESILDGDHEKCAQ